MATFLDIQPKCNYDTIYPGRSESTNISGSTCCVIYNDILDEWLFFTPGNKNIHLLKLIIPEIYFNHYFSSDLSNLYCFLKRDYAVGFNIRHFESILTPIRHGDIANPFYTIDINEYIEKYAGKSLSLNNIAQYTLQNNNITEHHSSPNLQWNINRSYRHIDVNRVETWNLDILSIYNMLNCCKMNVEVLHGIYTYGVENGYIRYFDDISNNVIEIEVDW
ncbi:hypothetical protein [Methanosalsum natronophilum]|uniref:hypothetical protein n=1 Tax=Methanosalsum natronophilum TaxID=768733 RepID=UPI0021699B03|nr:hypothetical protein [Methanosalsum natronophilum]MCS3924044.1 hypothetical protein [Methanosalsum natronophilum]